MAVPPEAAPDELERVEQGLTPAAAAAAAVAAAAGQAHLRGIPRMKGWVYVAVRWPYLLRCHWCRGNAHCCAMRLPQKNRRSDQREHRSELGPPPVRFATSQRPVRLRSGEPPTPV